MPMYFFDVLERDGAVTHDLVGVELGGPQQALETASHAIMDVLNENGMQHADFKVQVIVRDESGRELGRRDATLSRSDQAS